MKLILAIVLLSFSFSGHSFVIYNVNGFTCNENKPEEPCTFQGQACTRGDLFNCKDWRYWPGKIPRIEYVDKKIADTEEKIQTVNETLVQSINNLGTELKTGIVIKLLKEDDEFRKIIEEIVEAKMKAKSEEDNDTAK